MPKQQIDHILAQGPINADPIPGVVHDYATFNCAEGPFSDVRLRNAVAHGINKDIIIEGARWGYGTVTNIPFPSTPPWHTETRNYGYDPEKAKELMAEASYPDGLEIDMPVPNLSPLPIVAEIVQADPIGRKPISRANSISP